VGRGAGACGVAAGLVTPRGEATGDTPAFGFPGGEATGDPATGDPAAPVVAGGAPPAARVGGGMFLGFSV
jgi:hypothetical protein